MGDSILQNRLRELFADSIRLWGIQTLRTAELECVPYLKPVTVGKKDLLAKMAIW